MLNTGFRATKKSNWARQNEIDRHSNNRPGWFCNFGNMYTIEVMQRHTTETIPQMKDNQPSIGSFVYMRSADVCNMMHTYAKLPWNTTSYPPPTWIIHVNAGLVQYLIFTFVKPNYCTRFVDSDISTHSIEFESIELSTKCTFVSLHTVANRSNI